VFFGDGFIETQEPRYGFKYPFIGNVLEFFDDFGALLLDGHGGGVYSKIILCARNGAGVDSFVGKLAAIVQGSTETTFYVLAMYFGSVGIKNGRHALAAGLIADAVGLVGAIVVGYLFFG